LNPELLTVPKEKADELYEECRQILKQNTLMQKNQMLNDMRSIYNQLRRGNKIIDVWEAVKKAGSLEDGNPKLALIPADQPICIFRKDSNGSGAYGYFGKRREWEQDFVVANQMPNNTFGHWKTIDANDTTNRYVHGIVDRFVKCPTPVIPPKFLLLIPKNHGLGNYHILWEVEKWERIPPRDPMLLKQLTPNMFALLAHWNLTKLERAIIRGRL